MAISFIYSLLLTHCKFFTPVAFLKVQETANFLRTPGLFKSILANCIFSLLSSFSHHFKQVVFHWKQSDNKSLQVYGTLFSILTDLSKTVVLIHSILLLPQVSFPSLWGPLILPSPSYLTSFSAFLQRPNICVYFYFFSFSVCGLSEFQNPRYMLFFTPFRLHDLSFWPGFGDPFVSKCHREFLLLLFTP